MIPIVDFNNETTITRPRQDILIVMILQTWQNLIDAIIEYESYTSKGTEGTIHKIKSQAMGLVILIRTTFSKSITLDKKSPYKDIEDFTKKLRSENDTEVFEAINYLEAFLYSKGVLKWDSKEVFDKTNVFESNRRFLG